jgi:hypothetical protein
LLSVIHIYQVLALEKRIKICLGSVQSYPKLNKFTPYDQQSQMDRFLFYLVIFFKSIVYTVSTEWTAVYDELAWHWKEMAFGYFKLYSCNFMWGLKETIKNLSEFTRQLGNPEYSSYSTTMFGNSQ